MLSKFCSGLASGLMVSIGCAVYLACDNKYIGAALFCIALITICYQGYSLYTGKIGFMAYSHNKEDFSVLLLGLAGNIIGIVLASEMCGYALPKLSENAKIICEAKLAMTIPEAFIRAFFCGVLMFVAVSVFQKSNNVIGIVFAIPVFILSGYEHSIADVGYFAFANSDLLKSAIFVIIVILGNSAGSLTLPVLDLLGKAGKKNG